MEGANDNCPYKRSKKRNFLQKCGSNIALFLLQNIIKKQPLVII